MAKVIETLRRLPICSGLRVILYVDTLNQLVIICFLQFLNFGLKNFSISSYLLSKDEVNRIVTKILTFLRALSPVESDFTIISIAGAYGLVLLSVYFGYIRKQWTHYEHSNIFIGSYLRHKFATEKIISKRLDHYINILILSNRNHLHRVLANHVRDDFRELIKEIDQEHSFLISLKDNKEFIWPEVRKPHMRELWRRRYLTQWILGFVVVYVTMSLAISVAIRDSTIYRKENNIEYGTGFWYEKFFIEVIALPWSISDWIGILYAMITLEMIDNVELIRANKLSIVPLTQAIERFAALTEFISSGAYKSDQMNQYISKSRYICNCLALEAYVRTRYSLDLPNLRRISSTIRDAGLGVFSGIMLIFSLRSGLNPIETPVFILAIVSVSIMINSLTFVCAMHYTNCIKEFRRLLSSLATSMYSPIKGSRCLRPFQRSTVTPHTKLLWQRLLKNNEILFDRFAFRILNFWIVDYPILIRLNVTGIYCLALHFYQNRTKPSDQVSTSQHKSVPLR